MLKLALISSPLCSLCFLLWRAYPSIFFIFPCLGCHRAHTGLSSPCHTVIPTGCLCCLWEGVRVKAAVSIRPALSLPYWLHKSVLYVCVSAAALQINFIYLFGCTWF